MDRPQTTHAISVTGLCKTFGDRTVLDGIDLHVPAGTVFALLGANGAGKTTTVRILSTLLPFDTGQVEVAGHRLPSAARAVRTDISVTGQYASVDKLVTGRENLALMGDLHHLGRRKSVAAQTNSSPSSTSPTPRAAAPTPTPAGCADASTSR